MKGPGGNKRGGKGGGGGGGQSDRPNYFICVTLKDARIRAALVKEQTRLGIQELLQIPDSKFHFTLNLLRLPNESACSTVQQVLDRALASTWAFEQKVAGVDSLGKNVVFAKAAGEHSELSLLQKTIEEALGKECGELLHKEDRAWKAHCTLFKGRAASGQDFKLDQNADFGTDMIDEVQICRMGSGNDKDGYDVHGRSALLRLKTFQQMGAGEMTDRVLAECFALEKASYPADEAATFDRMELRSRRASDLFAVVLRGSRVIGFANSTLASGSLTAETMAEHDEKGNTVCLHSVVTASEERKRGIGGALVERYVALMKAHNPPFESIHLLSKEALVPFYEKRGFKCLGSSHVQHGQTKWFDCEMKLK